ncbi:hypothetical protein Poly24_31890 [Rosistilla carotiformis]|uniref:Carboxypeptidase regulatory-like domain-containing protein n=1 Tax=Rosistilla carotiformis TaxID=2528017 RepID=A0A518JVA1_9BACT|nr:hypothetical protein [Rosistilla carotiformis]QDV69473.1 hypothetical protein Poly24_31890 [Rosistilla carotiformis]
MDAHIPVLVAVAIGVATTFGCGQQQHAGELPVYPLSGTVLVDGKPVENIQVALHSTNVKETAKHYFPQGFTDAQGQIKVSTYADGDGAPAGDYRVTFVLKDYNVVARSFTGPNKIDASYSDAETSPVTITIGPDQPNDLGQLELPSN